MTTLHRHVFIVALAASWAGAAPGGEEPGGERSLRAAARDLFRIGVGIHDRIPERAADHRLLLAQFGMVTPENCMKPATVQPVEGEWRFDTADRFVDFAGAKGLKVVGHCLVWAKDREKKVPVHAVGLQGHYEIDRVPFQDIEDTLIALRGLGVKAVISELDIDVIPRARWWAEGGKHREELSRLDPYREGPQASGAASCAPSRRCSRTSSSAPTASSSARASPPWRRASRTWSACARSTTGGGS